MLKKDERKSKLLLYYTIKISCVFSMPGGIGKTLGGSWKAQDERGWVVWETRHFLG